jgi:diguanylate cyclase (GGDEF)-like protein
VIHDQEPWSIPEHCLPVAVWRIDTEGRLLEPVRIPGCPEFFAPAGPVSDALTPAYRVLWELTIWPTLKTAGALDEVVLELQDASGCAAVLSFWRACAGPNGQGFVAMMVPGVERARLLAQLRRAQDSLDAMPGAVLQVQRSLQGLRFPYASGQLLDLLGVTCTQAMNSAERLLDSLVPASREAMQACLESAERSHAKSWLMVLQTRRYPQRRIELSAQRDLPTSPWHCVLIDVSERERLLDELVRRAEVDELTQLPNRSGLLVRMADRLQSQRHFAVLYMDCDRFKQINDSLGHATGDQLLQLVARRLRGSLRPSDMVGMGGELGTHESMAARLGGDEFVVIAEGIHTHAEVQTLADRLVHTMGEPYQLGEHELVLSISMGVVLAGADSRPEQLLRDSDTAMYEAKRCGRNRWVLFEPAMQKRVALAMALETRLRQALAEGRVFPVFQPIVDIASGRITGFEALARWHDPERGFINPALFVQVAEDSGQIAALGEGILRGACTQFMHWHSLGLVPAQRLSVNVSRAQLGDAALPQRVERLLADLGMPPGGLQLEVTESLAMADDRLLEVLNQLRAVGCRLSLDDFGTGYSSLAALHRLPVQQVKLDRSFINEIETSPYHLAVVKAALQVARALALEVVAEGVESPAQAQTLTTLGCTRAQGWLYSRAVDPQSAVTLLRHGRLGP